MSQSCMLLFAGLLLVLNSPLAQATRKVAVPPWACAVQKCTNQAVDQDVAYEGPALNKKALLALRGAVQSQVLCPFGGDDPSAEGASKAEAASFFDGFAKAYDKLHGIETDDSATKAEVNMVAHEQNATAAAAGAVQKVNRESFTKLVNAKDQELLVVFYAPWCPHCKAFVLAENAPLDKLAKELAAAGGPKVVSFDTTASPMPYGFTANFIPTILLVSKDGKKSEFVEDPSAIEHLKAFALAGADDDYA